MTTAKDARISRTGPARRGLASGVRGKASRQRGAVVLLLALALFSAMALTLLQAHRRSLIEQRTSAQHLRSAQAFAAAEAGIDWAVAQLNAGRRVGDDCLPSPDPAAASFRSRLLRIDPASGSVDLVPGASAACVRSAGGWSCRCPAPGTPVSASASAGPLDDGVPAFSLAWQRSAAPGTVRLVATGCSRLAAPCAAAATRAAEASARIEVALALLPALPAPPAAAVTLGGTLDAGGSAIGLVNLDPATGWLVAAGGAVRAPLAHLTPPAGSPSEGAIAEHDPALAGAPADRFHAAFFGLRPDAWTRAQPVVSVRCPADCGDTIASEVQAAADGALIRVEGDLTVRGPRRFGSPERPLLLVATGAVRFEGAVELQGLLAAASLRWDAGSSPGWVRGAVVLAGDASIDAASTLIRDASTLDRLQHTTGRFVRVPGSWHDF